MLTPTHIADPTSKSTYRSRRNRVLRRIFEPKRNKFQEAGEI
jgi:hypothetical protein